MDSDRRIEDPHDKESIVFLVYPEETGGAWMRYEVRFQPGGSSAHSHLHPSQEQRLEVMQGRMGFKMKGVARVYEPGEKVVVPAGVEHFQRNAGDEELICLQEQHPAGEMENLLRNSFGLVRDGRMNTLQVAATLAEFSDVMRHTGWQRWILAALAPVARTLGYKGRYRKYERGGATP
jgi:quercetin dioxygenase-like cupin family protein